MFRAFALSIFLAFAGLTGFSQTAISDTLMADENYKLFQSGTLTRDSLISIYCSSAEDAQENHDFTASRVLLKKAESLLVSDTTRLFARISMLRANMAMEEDDRAEAIDLLASALKIYQSVGDSANYLETLQLIGINYDYIGDHDMAMIYYNDCIELAKLLDSKAIIGSCLKNIGGMYSQDGDQSEAIKYYEKSIVYAIESQDSSLIHRLYHGLGLAYRRFELYEEAYKYHQLALQVAIEINDLKAIGFGYQGLGFYYFYSKQYDSAEYYMDKTLSIAQRISNDQLKDNAREVLHQVYYLEGRYQEAFDSYKMMVEQSDSLYTIQNARLVESIKSKYQTERQERELAEKNLQLQEASSDIARHRNLQIILILCVLLLGAVLFLIYRGYVLRKRANDILRSKNAEIESHLKEIEDVTANKNRWFINVAHELRTPLTLIKGPIQKVLRSNDLSTDMRSDLELVHRNTKSLFNLVNEILDLSKMEEGEVSMKETVFSLGDLVKRTVSAFESRANQLGVTLKCVVNSDDQVLADQEKLEKVIVNLISNALKFTDKDGLVEIFVARSSKGTIKVVVKDTGRGIHAKDIDKVFDRFYQSDNQKRGLGGTGVGLALSKEIAEMHGGQLKVTSTPGMGSTFTLLLPEEILVDEHIIIPSIEELKVEVLGGGKSIESSIERKPILLLLDDNEDMTNYISSLLTPYFDVRVASNGVKGLDLLSNHDVKFIISDIMMPEMDGISFLKEVKQNTNWRHIPFIHLTALSDETLRKELFQIGVDDYLLKPFDSEELIIRVRNLYSNYNQRISLVKKEDELVSYDEKLISKLRQNVFDNIDDTNYNVLRLADAAAMSERQLYRYLKSATGLTPLQFIQEIKLNYANELARKKAYSNISELSAAVGFKQASYFSNLFEKRFGKKPGAILKS